MRNSFVLAVVLMSSVSCQGQSGSTKVAGAAPKTVISAARIQGGTLLISANYFAPSTTVTLGGTTLKVGSSKTSELTATLPDPLAAGTYLLNVTGGTPQTTDSFSVTVGATGPAGPPGASAHFPSGISVLGETATPPKGFSYTGYYVISQGGTTGWTLKTPMPTARMEASVAVVRGIVFVIGGAKDSSLQGLSTVEAYDPDTDSWTTRAPMPTGRYGAGIGVLNGIIYVVGGSQKGDAFTGAFEAYDPATNKWTAKTAIPTPKKGVVTAVLNNVMYVLGDFASFNAAATATTAAAPGMEAYDPATETWSQKAPIPTARTSFSVGVANGLLYACGGAADGLASAMDAYDPATNTWTPKAPMPVLRKGFSFGVINGILYAAGGSNEAGLLGATHAYDPMHDSWTTSLSLLIPTEMTGGAVTDSGVFYLVGGLQAGGKTLASVQAFSPSGPRFYVHKSQ